MQDYISEIKGYTDIRGPRPVIEQAFQDQIITDGVAWLAMLKSRNLTSQLYDEKEIEKVLTKIRDSYFALFTEFKTYFDKL